MYLLKYILVFVYCSVTQASEGIESLDLKVLVDGKPVSAEVADQNSTLNYNVGQNITFICKVENSNVPSPAIYVYLNNKQDGSITATANSGEKYMATFEITATAADNDSEVYCIGDIWDSSHQKFLPRYSIVKKLIMNSDESNITPEEKISILKEQYLQELRKIKNDSDENDLCNCSCDISGKKTTDTLQKNDDVTDIETNSVIVKKDNDSLNEGGKSLEADHGQKLVDFITTSFQKLTDSKKKKQLKLVNQQTTVEIREID